eukprot:UN28572
MLFSSLTSFNRIEQIFLRFSHFLFKFSILIFDFTQHPFQSCQVSRPLMVFYSLIFTDRRQRMNKFVIVFDAFLIAQEFY